MLICGFKRTRNRGLCQYPVAEEGERCKRHSEEAEQLRQQRADAKANPVEDHIADINAESIEDLQKKLELESDVMARLERSLRDPDDTEGEDIYIAIGRRNVIRMQIAYEEDSRNRGLAITVGNMIGQLKINEKRHLESQKQRLELIKLRREIAAVQSDKTDVLSYMAQVNNALADGFYEFDPSPRRSLEAYMKWLGEDVTEWDVLEGRAETASAPWAMQREILTSLFWPEQLEWTAGDRDPATNELIYHTGKPDLKYTICVTGNNMGKSYISARCVLFNACFLYPSITIVTGPRLSQVRDTVSAEARRKHTEMGLPGKSNILRWQPNPENDRAYVNYTSAQSDDAFAGHHGRILIIMEEASGVPNHIYESTHGLMSGSDCRMLQIGNMHYRKGRFYEYYDKTLKNPSDQATHLIQKSAFDHPNYVHRDFIKARGGNDIYQHGVSAEWVDESIALWGYDSHRAAIRIHGQPPKQDTNSMISLDLVEEAVAYEYPEDEAAGNLFQVEYEVIFADIAGMGDNLTVIGGWQWGQTGHRIFIRRVMSTGDHSDIADAMLDSATRPKNDELYFSCDTNGEGSGILEMLIERSVEEDFVEGFKSHNDPEDELRHNQAERYANLEAENWARMRRWLRRSQNSIYRDEKGDLEVRIDMPGELEKYSAQTVRELTERDHSLEGGKVTLQPKKEYMEQLGDSPDFAEAVIIGCRMVHRVQQLFLGKDSTD